MLHRIGLALASLTMLTLPALADGTRGTITVVGRGEAVSPPELTELRLTVTSLCYDTSVAAKNANAQLSTKLVALLQSYQSDPLDKVTAVPGSNERRDESYKDSATPSHIIVLCSRKWHATEEITLTLKGLDKIAVLQDRILAAIDQQVLDTSQTSQTYAELSAPYFGLTDTTMQKLRSDAQSRAYDDAKRQFDVFAGRCHFQDVQLNSIKPPEYQIYQGGGQSDQAGSEAPVIPDTVSVSASWSFEWSFAPTAGCQL